MRHSTDSARDDGSVEYRAYARAPSRSGGRLSGALPGVCAVLLLLTAAALLYVRQYTVAGASMEPTLLSGDRAFYIGFVQPDYGDLVIFDAGEVYGLVIKRVAGLPGDTIAITPDGRVVRNGTLQNEAYITPDALGNSAMEEIRVESGKLFLLGDNRAESIDSRDVRVGQVDLTSVRGVVIRTLRKTG